VVTAGSNTYCYDKNGNQVRRTLGGTTYSLTYDLETRLTGVSGGATAGFTYNADGVRVKRTAGSPTPVTTVYVGNYYEKNTSTGVVTRYYYAGGQRVVLRAGSSLSYLYSEHLGSTAITANSSGGFVAELRYWPYGSTRYMSGTTPTDRRFTGQREDATIGLYDYRARYYDAALARFIQPDPIVPAPGNPQDLNRYTYARNNPQRYVDPDGRRPTPGCEYEGCSLRPGLPADRTWQLPNGVYAIVDPQLSAKYLYNPLTEGVLPGAVMFVGGVAGGMVIEAAIVDVAVPAAGAAFFEIGTRGWMLLEQTQWAVGGWVARTRSRERP
jgi:RHS repeat-associated protein